MLPSRVGRSGYPPRTCSPECRAARVKLRRKERYARGREQAIAYTRQWTLANRENVRERQRRYREENKEEIVARKKQHYLANRDQETARRRAYYRTNRETIRAAWAASRTDEARAVAAERTRQWAVANPERRAELRRKWAESNAEKVAVIRHRRRARIKGVPADDVTVTDLMIDQDFLCYLCNGSIDPDCRHPDLMSPSIDHIVPLARGGTSLRENVAAAHLRCNLLKGDRLLAEAS